MHAHYVAGNMYNLGISVHVQYRLILGKVLTK